MPSTNFTFPGQRGNFTLPQGPAFYVLATIILIGTLSCFALVLAAIIAVAYLLNVAISALCDVAMHIATIYSQGDSLTKLIVWLFVIFFLMKISPRIAVSLKRSFFDEGR